MEKYILKIELLSDAIFSGGESIVSISDIDVLYDDYKIPYYKGKSIKGNIRECADIIVENQKEYNPKLAQKNQEIIINLFGKKYYKDGIEDLFRYRDDQTQGILKFENASLDENIKENLIYLVDKGEIKKEEIISSLTDIRYATKIDRKTGTAKNSSLRSMRVLNKDIIFYANIFSERELKEDELGILICAVKTVRHLGTLRSRGKGEVRCTILSKKSNFTDKEVEKLIKKVVG